MKLINSKVSLISFFIAISLSVTTNNLRSLYVGNTLKFDEEYFDELFYNAAICIALAIIIGIIKDISEQEVRAEPMLEALDFDVLNNKTEIPLLNSDNEYELRLINAGYQIEFIDIPDEYSDPVSYSIMANPVILLTDDPRCSHTVDFNTYEYLMTHRNGSCLISGKAIRGYITDLHLKLLIEAWVIAAELAPQNLSKARQEEEMHAGLLKLNYYGTLFNRRKEGNAEVIELNNTALSL